MADQPGGPEQADLCLRLIRLFPRVVRGMRRWQDRATPPAHGPLGPRHIAALEQLRGGPVTVSELAARLGLTLPTVSGVLAELDRAGFVERHPDPGDRRRTIVEISPARAAVIGQWLDGAASPLARVLDKLSPSEQQAFLKAMNLLETELQSNNSGPAARDDSRGDGQAPAGEAENARARGARRLPGSGAGSRAVVLSRAAGCHGYPPGRRMPRIMPAASSASGSRRSRTAAAVAWPASLCIRTAGRHAFSAHEIIRMESIANQAGLAIAAARRRTAHQADMGKAAAEIAELTHTVSDLRKAGSEQGALLGIVSSGRGLGAVVEALARMFRCAILVADPLGRVLARAGSGAVDLPAIISFVRREIKLSGSAAVATPADSDGDDSPGWVSPVVVGDEVSAYVCALQSDQRAGVPDRSRLERATAVVALALFAERTAQEVEWRLSRDFVDQLLESGGASPDLLLSRAVQLGTDLTSPHTVVVARPDGPEPGSQVPAGPEWRSLLALAQRVVSEGSSSSLVATRGDHVVVLWADHLGRTAADFAETLRREVHAYADGWTASISIGPKCQDVREYGDGYALTLSVLDMVQQGHGSDRVVSLDTAGAYRLLLQVKRPRELALFARATLGPVQDYDAKHQTQLLATLRCYLKHQCDLTRTAKQLWVHHNTVSYRLRRVEKLLDIELSNPRELLELQLALMILDVIQD